VREDRGRDALADVEGVIVVGDVEERDDFFVGHGAGGRGSGVLHVMVDMFSRGNAVGLQQTHHSD
jgi:hypothetical protein|tara:strand:- start:1850 stop:2044 length:195 start_codon:yes stop_codon:yes gene_type:complete